MNTRGFHWTIKVQEFFGLHIKFEGIYNALVFQIDEIAELILTLEGTPIHSYTDNVKNSLIAEKTNITDGNTALEYILDGYKTIISLQRVILELAGEINDEGTVSQMSDYITL
jgi:starvation-inducible DNA-binding protein|tara:strand:+ start:59 stop:397 length:339 start_codon:yes stop_codon:yes gene_type:complete